MSSNDDNYGREYEFQEINEEKKHGSLTGGLSLIALGIIFMLATFIPSIRIWNLWPILIVAIGIGLSSTMIVKFIKSRRAK